MNLKSMFVFLPSVIAIGCAAPAKWTETTVDLADHFQGFDGCFAMLDLERSTYVRFNPARCAERFSLCSTFKIPHSLIGLETKAVADEGHVFEWDGSVRSRKVLNRDHELRSALANSVLWYYRKLAARIGEAKMQHWLHRIRYGNEDISGGLIRFWLAPEGSLKISADEQVAFLRRLYLGTLPFSERSQRIVRELMVLSRDSGRVLRGKTGTAGKDGNAVLGWFVGYITQEGKAYVFACNISGASGATGFERAKAICMAVLDQLVPS